MAKKKTVTAEDLKGKSQDELKAALMDARKEQFNARLQRAAGQLTNTASMRTTRRQIARIKTQMNASAEAAATPAAPKKTAKKSAKA